MTVMIAALPFMAALLYGLGYVMIERVVGININATSFLIVSTVAQAFVILGLFIWKNEDIDLSGLMPNWQVLLIVIIAGLAPCIGWAITIYSIKHISALYTALAETSYPLFTLAFGFLLFGIRQFNMTTFLGGALILAGAAIMIYGQSSEQQNE